VNFGFYYLYYAILFRYNFSPLNAPFCCCGNCNANVCTCIYVFFLYILVYMPSILDSIVAQFD